MNVPNQLRNVAMPTNSYFKIINLKTIYFTIRCDRIVSIICLKINECMKVKVVINLWFLFIPKSIVIYSKIIELLYKYTKLHTDRALLLQYELI